MIVCYIILQLIREHCSDDYDSVEKLLRFDTSRYDSAIEIEIVKKDAEDYGWMITLESEQKVKSKLATSQIAILSTQLLTPWHRSMQRT